MITIEREIILFIKIDLISYQLEVDKESQEQRLIRLGSRFHDRRQQKG